MAFTKVGKGKTQQIRPLVRPHNKEDVQSLVEKNLEDIFGVRFVATEFQTGVNHGGRIDTLGLDAHEITFVNRVGPPLGADVSPVVRSRYR